MSENGFIPFSPRRLERVIESSPHVAAVVFEASGVPDAALDSVDVIACVEADCFAAPREPLESGAAHAAVHPEITAAGAAIEASHIDAALGAARIRGEAIILAAAACARALRYAVDRNPRLLARFVDDALRAAGSPRHAIVRLAQSAAISECEQSEHDYVADASLAPGDVFVDCADGTLGATIEQRAEGLVRAASS